MSPPNTFKNIPILSPHLCILNSHNVLFGPKSIRRIQWFYHSNWMVSESYTFQTFPNGFQMFLKIKHNHLAFTIHAPHDIMYTLSYLIHLIKVFRLSLGHSPLALFFSFNIAATFAITEYGRGSWCITAMAVVVFLILRFLFSFPLNNNNNNNAIPFLPIRNHFKYSYIQWLLSLLIPRYFAWSILPSSTGIGMRFVNSVVFSLDSCFDLIRIVHLLMSHKRKTKAVVLLLKRNICRRWKYVK